MSDYASIKRKLLATPGALFEDKSFPASNASLYIRSPWSTSIIEWKRPHEIVPKPKFIVDKAQYVDLEQGRLGNCWFVAAAASLAANDKTLLHRVVPHDQSFHKEYCGIFRFYFWQYGEWKEVVVDDRLPVKYGSLIYTANTRQENEFWVALLEKAYAKLYGNYELIDGGRVHDALLDLTGGVTEMIAMKDTSPPALNTVLTQCYHMHTLMGGAIFGTGAREALRETGLYEGHAYSIIKLKTVRYRGKELLLLLIRNPFGRGDWNGAWSDKSHEWSEVSAADRTTVQAWRKHDDGEFWMSVEDFIEHFDELELCHLSLDAITPELHLSPGERKRWKRSEFRGRWVRGVSAGGPFRSFTSRQFWSNPQYRVKISNNGNKEGSVVISLLEVTDKLVRDTADISIGFVIFRLKPGQEPPGRINEENYYEHMPQLVDTSGTFWPYRERAVHFRLEPGTYVIVPCTFRPHKEADFYLRVFSETSAAAEPVEEPIGPTEEISPEPEDIIERLFTKHQSEDGTVDAFQLKHILDEAKLQEYSKSDGYSLETCRCLLSLLDTPIQGSLRLDKARKAWKHVQQWTRAFRSADTSHDNTVDAFELKEMYKKIGFVLDTRTLQRIVRRYGGREGKIHEDDFLQSFCRVLSLYLIFKKKSSNGKITQDLSEFLSNALYV